MATSMGDPDGACFTVLPQPMRIGLSFTALAGVMSASMVLMLLGLVARNFIRNLKNPPPGGEWRLIRTHIDAYLLSQLASEILQGVGATMNSRWAIEGVIYCSDYCSVQSALKVIGETGVAMSTLAIAVHTFVVIFFWWIPGPRSVWIYRIAITLIWGYSTLFVIIAFFRYRASNYNSDPNVFFSPIPYWCWISGGNTERLVGAFLWYWISAILSVFLYTLLFFRLRGNIRVDPQNWKSITFRLHADPQVEPTAASREARAVIWYPICYIILVTPLSCFRWAVTKGINFGYASFAYTLFSLSGVVSVILTMLIRRNLLLLGPNRGVLASNGGRDSPSEQSNTEVKPPITTQPKDAEPICQA